MVNLLSGRTPPEPFPELDAQAWDALILRLGRCIPFSHATARLTFEADVEALTSELEELESAPALASASWLVEGIDQMRLERLAELEVAAPRSTTDVPDAAWEGSLLCYFPGRALATGESEVASRGYFDVLDRPPFWSWVAAVGRPAGGPSREFEVGILAWVAQQDLDSARAGCRASASPSVMPIEEGSAGIAAQWRAACERGLGEA